MVVFADTVVMPEYSTPLPPAGWYPDPLRAIPEGKRYWNGTEWTVNLIGPGPLPYLFPPGFTEKDVAATSANQSSSPVAQVAELDEWESPAIAPEQGSSSKTLQRVLLSFGGVLVLTAVVAFLAFIWGSVGPYGQAAILISIAAGFLVAAIKVKRLTATREVFSLISWGIMTLLLATAPSFHLFPSNFYEPGRFTLPGTIICWTVVIMLVARAWHFMVLRVIGWGMYLISWFSLLATTQHYLTIPNPLPLWVTGLAIAGSLTLLVPKPVASMHEVRAVVSGFLFFSASLAVLVMVTDEREDVPWEVASLLVCILLAALLSYKSVTYWAISASRLAGFALAGFLVGLLIVSFIRYPQGSVALAVVTGAVVMMGIIPRFSFLLPVGAPTAFAGGASLMWITGFRGIESWQVAGWSLVAVLAVTSLWSLLASIVNSRVAPIVVFAVTGELAVMLALVLRTVTLVEVYAISTLAVAYAVLLLLRRQGVLSRVGFLNLVIGVSLLETVPSLIVAWVSDPSSDFYSAHLAVGLVGVMCGFVWAYLSTGLVKQVAWVSAGLLIVTALTSISAMLPGDPTIEYYAFSVAVPLVLAAWLSMSRVNALDFTRITILALGAVSAVSFWAWLVAPHSHTIPFDYPWLSFTVMAVGLLQWAILAESRTWTIGYWAVALQLFLTVALTMHYRLDIEQWELYCVIAGAFYMFAALPTKLRFIGLHSIAWMAPVAFLFTTPYALTWGTDAASHTLGFIAILFTSTAMMAFGAQRKIAGLFVPGAVNITIIVVAQLVLVAGIIPVWVSLAFCGAALLALGVRLEWSRQMVREGSHWVRELV